MHQLLAPAPSYLESLSTRVLVFDGAMGTSIQRFNLSPADFGGKAGCNDYLVLSKPDVVEEIHHSFLDAGADVVETCTFQATRRRLAEWGLGERTYELNVEAARLARRVANRFGGRLVAGALGPTGMLPSSSDPALSAITFDELRELFREQAAALLDGGADLLMVETAQDMLELKAALFGIRDAQALAGRRVPVQAQITLDVAGRMLLGTDISGALATLEGLPCDAIGLNCSTGPEHMREPIRYLCQHSSKPVACIPNAGLPVNDGSGDAVYLLGPEPMAAELRSFVTEFGVSAIGGCCGTTPEHIKAFVAATRGVRPHPSPLPEGTREPRIASAVRAISLWQEPRPLIIGERVNTQGSRKVKQLLLADDYDAVVEIARGQADEGAHALDVCCALTERQDEAAQMREVVRRLAAAVEVPLVIDSTEADVVEVALEHYPGRPIVNSIHLGEEDRLRKVLPLVRDHGAAVIAMSIDQAVMAKTAARKLEAARSIYAVASGEYGLAPEALIFDTLTFPLSTGQEDLVESAVESIEAIRDIKRELPGVLTVLGVSNVSFGLSPRSRPLLNSMFLHHALAAGLDLAIVHPSQVRPVHEIPAAERELAEDLIFNRRADALPRFIAYFEGDTGPHPSAVEEDDGADVPVEQRIHDQILHRKKAGIEALLDEAMLRHSPVAVLNEVLLPAMKHVGDLFGAGELILPYVLQSAEVMKAAVAHLEQFLEKHDGYTKGKVVLATVFGDVHDIGKNLVATILANNGYTVYDLGKQVPINQIVDKAVEVGADAIGLSALLVSTSKQMPLCVQELHRRGLDIPVLVGGAAINPRFGHRILFVEEDRPYAPGVFYNKDAFEGLAAMDVLTDVERRPSFVASRKVAAERSLRDEARREAARCSASTRSMRSEVTAVQPPRPPFWGARIVNEVDRDELFRLIDRKTLFALHWGGSKKHGADRERLFREEFEPLLASLWADYEGLIEPWAAYGYFRAEADGDALEVEGRRFEFPRQAGNEHLCLADYFGQDDVAPLQFVTVGGQVSQRIEELQAAGEYSQMYFLHGLGVSTAEAMADYVHRRIQAELGLPAGQGKRYSWGYPACPDLSQHQLVFDLLPARQQAGVDLTEMDELVPEQSTAALIVHHPGAIYFAMHDAAL